jgi:hypothetical protein
MLRGEVVNQFTADHKHCASTTTMARLARNADVDQRAASSRSCLVTARRVHFSSPEITSILADGMMPPVLVLNRLPVHLRYNKENMNSPRAKKFHGPRKWSSKKKNLRPQAGCVKINVDAAVEKSGGRRRGSGCVQS